MLLAQAQPATTTVDYLIQGTDGSFFGTPITYLIFTPLVGALLMMLVPKGQEAAHKVVALATSLVAAGIGIWILFNFNYDQAGTMQFSADLPWITAINSRYIVGLDGISLPLLILTLGIVPLCIIYSWNHFPEPKDPKAFLILILVLETGMIGSFIARDLILFFVFFEVVLLPMFFLIGVWGGEQRQYASIKFFLYTLFGSALMIVAFLAVYFLSNPVLVDGATAPVHTFSMQLLSQGQGAIPAAAAAISAGAAIWIFGGMFIGFAIKVPMFPFHTWLPDAHTQAPTVGSVILAAVLLKLGTYGFIRIAIPILPEAAKTWAPAIGILAVIGIIYGALCCLAQTDMKRLIAFSSVAHMGFVMLAISTLTVAGINAAIFGMVAHGLITGMLFFIAGSTKERYHTLEIKRLGGMLVQAPRMGWIFGFCAMASLGLPGLAGFWGEFPAILATFNAGENVVGGAVTNLGLNLTLFRVLMVIAAFGTVFAAGYLLWLFQRVAFGTPKAEFANDPHIHDATPAEWIAWVPILVLIVLFGLVPGLIFNVTDPAVTQAVSQVHDTVVAAGGK